MSSVYHFVERKKLAGFDSISVVSIADSVNKTSLEKATPYSRIFSKNNLRAQNLPTFLITKAHHKGLTLDDLRRADFLSIPSHTTVSMRVDTIKLQSMITTTLKNMKRLYFLKDSPPNEDSIMESKVIEIMNGSKNDCSITIKNRNIPGEDLAKLAGDKDLSKNIINVFMQHLKQINRVSNKYENMKIRANIATVEFSESIFIRGILMKQQNLVISSYDYFVFPIFHHYWRLLVHDTVKNIAYMYDLGNNNHESDEFLEHLKSFWSFNDQPIDGIKLEIINEKGIHLWNSGILILKATKNIIQGINTKISLEEVADYRLEILITLLKLSQINLLTI